MVDDEGFRRESVQSWQPPSMEDVHNVQYDFTIPSFDVGNYEMYDIENITMEDFSHVTPPPNLHKLPDPSNLRMSQLGLTDIPDIEDIPDVSQPNMEFHYDYDYAVPDFSVPPPVPYDEAEAHDVAVSSSVPSNQSSATNSSKKSSKKKKKKKNEPKVPELEEAVPDEDNHDNNEYDKLMNQWHQAAEGKNEEEEEKSSKHEEEPTTNNNPQKDTSVFHPLPTSSIFRPMPTTTSATKEPPAFDMTRSLDKVSTDIDDEEPKRAAKALLEEHLKEPLEEIESFPRRGKNPKQPKRDQEDIPKTLVVEEDVKPRRESVQPVMVQDAPSAPRPLIVEEGGANIPKLLFEGAASLEQTEVEESLEELSQAFLKSNKKCEEAVDLGGHGIVVITMKKWIHSTKIQQLGCECLHNFIYNYKQSEKRLDIFEALAVMGAMETIIASMDNFPESLSVQRSGLAALGNLLYGQNQRMEQRTRNAVEELDFITTVVGAMRRFPKDSVVQGCGCIILANLFKVSSDYKSKLTEAGALLDVAAAVTNNPTNSLIEKEASAFMKLYFDWR